ncbi:MAG: hypothetical protein AAF581_05955 [Planctomycetota bacterium]
MTRLQLLQTVVLAAVAVTAVVYWVDRAVATQPTAAAELAGRLDRVDDSIEALQQSLQELSAASAAAAAVPAPATARVSDRELSEESSPDAPASGVAATSTPVTDRGENSAIADAATEEEFRRLLDAMLSGDGDQFGAEEQQRFWELTRTPLLAKLLTELESEVERRPQDEDLRMELADMYVAKLLSVPAGPERGIWSNKAEAQWRHIATENTSHWESRYRVGENLSYYPAFLNKTEEATQWLDEALQLQRQLPAEPRHARTYLRLSQMYQQQSKISEARAVLEEGVGRHPASDELRTALQRLPAADATSGKE